MSTPFITKLERVICDKYERYISLKFRIQVEKLLNDRLREHAANIIQYVYRDYKNRIKYKNILFSLLEERLYNKCAYRIQKLYRNYVKHNLIAKGDHDKDHQRSLDRIDDRSSQISSLRNINREQFDNMSLGATLSDELSKLDFGITN